VAGGVVLAADLPRRLAAEFGGRVEGGDVGDAGQEHLDRAGVEDDLAAVVAPAAGELGFAVHDGDDLDALPPESTARRQRDGQIWVTSSRPISSGGSRRRDADAWPICAAA
jgi:hypothetical protein